jgi:hypothetical protein
MYRERERKDRNSNSEREKEEREDLPPRFLPPNLLLIFISFYWLIFILLLFCFGFEYFYSFYFLFVMVMAISIHLIDMPLDEECMIYQRSSADMGKHGSHPFILHTFCVGLLHTSSCGIIFVYMAKRGSHPLYFTHFVWGYFTHLRVGLYLFRTINVVGLFNSKPSVLK